MALKNLFNEVEFLTQYPMVGLAISDNTSPTPGYLYGEINAITYVENGNYCKPLISFLVSRLKSDTPIICIKVLKLLMYLVKNGHSQVIQELKCHEVRLKEARSFNGPPDDVHGSSFYQTVRKMAKELLDVIFNENREVEKPLFSEQTSFSGYGSEASSKTMTGFGYSAKVEKTVSDVVSDSFSSFVEKLFPSPEKETLSMTHLSDALPKYKPLIIEKTQSEEESLTSMESSLKSVSDSMPKPERKVKVHRPGRAGGGWESSSDEDDYQKAVMVEEELCEEVPESTESSENEKSTLFYTCDISDESKVVEEFAVNKPLNEINYADVELICCRCSTLNIEEILSLSLQKLSDSEELIQLRALILIEYLLFHDVVSLESLKKIVVPFLQTFLEEGKEIKTAVKIKALKIQAGIEILKKKLQRKMASSEQRIKCN